MSRAKQVILGDSAENALWHLRGAKAILECSNSELKPFSNPRLAFLAKVFHYFDVMTALSLRQAPLSPPYTLEHIPGTIDEIFGLSTSLWPAMHLLAKMLASDETTIVDDDTILQALALVEQLSEPSTIANDELQNVDDHSVVDVEALVQISSAYRSSVLLTLHHEVLHTQDTRLLDSVYRQSLDSLLRIAALDGPLATYSTSVWPLHTTCKYARSTSDRTILKHIFSKISRRHHMRIVDTADQSIDELWQADMRGTARSLPQVFFA